MSRGIRVDRLSPRQRERESEVWLVCRNCGEEIPASAKNHAYCDVKCKEKRMEEEMWNDKS